MTTKFGLKRLEIVAVFSGANVFWYLEQFWHGSRVWQTDRSTKLL